jgi:endonuclease/exonuclease/phosphatase family metal-dependent hydrolase
MHAVDFQGDEVMTKHGQARGKFANGWCPRPRKPFDADVTTRHAGGMKRAWFLCLLAACSGGEARDTLRVMTFNIHYDDGSSDGNGVNTWAPTSDGKPRRRERVVAVIKEQDPDILGVQEALANQVHDLQQRLEGYDFYGVGRDDGVEAGEFAGIFFRASAFTRVESGTFWLSDTPEQPGTVFEGARNHRIASWVKLDGNHGGKFLVMNTHWEPRGGGINNRFAELVVERLATLATGRTVLLLGDFNSTPTSDAVKTILDGKPEAQLHLVDAYRRAYPRASPFEGTISGFIGVTFGPRIDHIFSSPELHTRAAQIVRWRDGLYFPSDHFPLRVDFDGPP